MHQTSREILPASLSNLHVSASVYQQADGINSLVFPRKTSAEHYVYSGIARDNFLLACNFQLHDEWIFFDICLP